MNLSIERRWFLKLTFTWSLFIIIVNVGDWFEKEFVSLFFLSEDLSRKCV